MIIRRKNVEAIECMQVDVESLYEAVSAAMDGIEATIINIFSQVGFRYIIKVIGTFCTLKFLYL